MRSASPSVVLEADVVSVIYRSLSETGYSTSQIALETYFGFAPGAMQQRPDIACLSHRLMGISTFIREATWPRVTIFQARVVAINGRGKGRRSAPSPEGLDA